MKARIRNSTALRSDWWCFYKRIEAIKKAARADAEVMAIITKMDELNRQLSLLQDGRRLAEAERKDKGEVLWTVCFPRKYAYARDKFITRTPHRITDGTFTIADPITQAVRCYHTQDPWRHLDEVWHKKEAA